MTVAQAVSIAVLTLEWEAETAAAERGHKDLWAQECRAAAALVGRIQQAAPVTVTPAGRLIVLNLIGEPAENSTLPAIFKGRGVSRR
jgi:hypothetical protein